MWPWTAMFGTLLFTGADLIITTFLYTKSCKRNNTAQDQTDLTICNSQLDVWGSSLLRGFLLCGALVGVTKYRLWGHQSLKSSLVSATLICSYALMKLLLHSGVKELVKDPWFWGLLIWTCASSATTLSFWWLLPQVARSAEDQRTRTKGTKKAEESHGNSPGSKQDKDQASGVTIVHLLSYCKSDAVLIGAAIFFLLGSTLADIFSPYYAGLVLDGIVNQKSLDLFSNSMGFLILYSLVSAFSAGVRAYLFCSAYTRLNLRIRHLLFKSLLSQEIGFFDENHTGDITSRLTADTAKMSDVIASNVQLFLRSAVKVLGIIIMMFTLSWKLSLVTILGFPVILLVPKMYGAYYKKLAEQVQNAHAQANNIAVEVISAMKTVKSFANEETEAVLYWEKLQQVHALCKKEAVAYTFFDWSTSLTQLVLQFSILYYGCHLVITNQMSNGNLISFVIYVFLLGDCMRDINSVFSTLMQGVGAAAKVFQFLKPLPASKHYPQCDSVCFGIRSHLFAHHCLEQTRPDSLPLPVAPMPPSDRRAQMMSCQTRATSSRSVRNCLVSEGGCSVMEVASIPFFMTDIQKDVVGLPPRSSIHAHKEAVRQQ